MMVQPQQPHSITKKHHQLMQYQHHQSTTTNHMSEPPHPRQQYQQDQTIIDDVETLVPRKQNDSSSIATNSSLSSMSTTHTNNSSVISIATMNTNPFDVHRRRDDGEYTIPPSLLQLMESIQINPSSSDSCNDGTSIATFSITTSSPSELDHTTTVDNAINISCGSSSSTSTCSGSHHHHHHHHRSKEHDGNVLLHELIMDYPINVLTYPHRRQEYEEQIRNVAQLHPEWVITYNQNGYTPFHIACQTGGMSLQIIQDLFYIYPSAITTPTRPPARRTTIHRPHRRRNRRCSSSAPTISNSTSLSKTTIMLPLHLTCRYYTGLEQYNIIAFLIQMYPEAVKVWTKSNINGNCSHVNDTNTKNNVTKYNEDGSCGDELAIHLYCQNHFCNILVLRQLLIPTYPESIQTFNYRTGQLPIHLVCERQYFQRVVNKKYDMMMKTTTIANNTAIQCIPSKYSSSNSDIIIAYLLPLYPKSVTICDLQRGELPFTTALRGYQSLSTLQQLLSYHSTAITHVDAKGRTPLHRYCMMLASHQDGNNTSSDAIIANDGLLSFLIQQDINHVAGTIIDHTGHLPLHYIMSRSNVSLDIVYTLVRSYPTSIFDIIAIAATATTTTTNL